MYTKLAARRVDIQIFFYGFQDARELYLTTILLLLLLSSFKYLCVVFNAGRKLSVDTDAFKRKFYTACCLLVNTYSLNEILRINL